MPHLVWSPPALRDVQRLYRFLAAPQGTSATRAIQAIRMGVRRLAQQPYLGRPVEEMESNYREWLIPFGQSGYVVLYRLAGERVVILAVRHQREVGYSD